MTEPRNFISLVVLAAGKSSRFGSNKLLSEIEGETMIQRVVRTSLASKASEVVVVVGFEEDKIRYTLQSYECRIVSNPEFEKGQTSSVIAGMNSVKKHANAAMILPGDLAFIKPEQIDKVIDEYNLAPSSIVVASYRGRMGHPILFDHALFDEMLKITEEKAGLKEVVNRHRSEIRRIEVESREILVDIDIPYDLRSLEKEKGPKTV